MCEIWKVTWDNVDYKFGKSGCRERCIYSKIEISIHACTFRLIVAIEILILHKLQKLLKVTWEKDF